MEEKERQESALKHADDILKLSKREILAKSLGSDSWHKENYRIAMALKNQEINEKLVRVTQRLAWATIILSGLTIFFQFLK